MTSSPLVDLRNQRFMLNEVLDLPALLRLPAFAEHGEDAVAAVLDAAHTLAVEVFLPQAAEARTTMRAALEAQRRAGALSSSH